MSGANHTGATDGLLSSDNACRYEQRPGHVESWFIRANDPSSPRALWLKMTILAPLHGAPVAETWLIWFDGTSGQTLAHKQTVPLAEALFSQATIRVGPCRFEWGSPSRVSGELQTRAGPVSYQLELQSLEAPLCLFPSRALLRTAIPRAKTVTPGPVIKLNGELRLPGETVSVANWYGSQGHNWGQEHTFEYAWGQCVFAPDANGPLTMVEGYSARVKVGGGVLPRMSGLVVRRGDDEYRFDRTFDFFRQEATLTPRRWTVRLRSSAGEARLRIDASERPMVCLGYENPNGEMSYCFNSKLSQVLLEVRPTKGAEFHCRSEHSGALEFLRRTAESGLEVI